MELFENIKKAAAAKGMSIAALERKLGFGSGSIQRWKDHSPLTARLQAVADELGVTIDELLHGRG